jgi:hypothetical protein
MRTITLGYGKGIEGKKACWMTALQAHLGGKWTDYCDCVSPAINWICIAINDTYYKDDLGRTEDILAFGLFDPIGTFDPAREEERVAIMVKAAREVWLPKAAEFGARADDVFSVGYIAAAPSGATAALYAAANAAFDSAFASPFASPFYRTFVSNAVNTAVGAAAKAARRAFLRDHVYPVLREMIGPIRQEIVPSEAFYERIGCV